MSTPQAQQILFIDAGVTDVATLLASIDPSIEVVQLHAGEDGLAQIARALDGRTGIDAVHIISHGQPGALMLGGVQIDEAALATHSAELATIRAALSESADMLLYGCDVAAGDTGAQFTQALAAATGADVAASTDTTGAAFLGGNWTLETHVGAIETTALAFDNYDATLGADAQLPAGLAGNGPWTWGGVTFQTKLNGEITDSDPENPLRAGNKWDRYALTGVAAGTTVYVYMGNSSSVDDYLQIDRNGTIITQDDDRGDGERSYDAYVSWVYQPGDVIRATTFSAGYRGTYSLYIGTSTGTTATGTDIGNAPAPVPTPTAPTFTDANTGLLHTYNDTGATDTFTATTGTFTATDTTPTNTMRFSGGGVGQYGLGTLTVAANGAYSYTPDAAAVNALNAGESRTESFLVSVSDGALSSSKTVTFNIVGANDAPTLAAGVTLASVLEDTAATSAANPGRTVTSLVGGVFADVDTGASLGGIVIVGNAATAGQGVWQYSTDGTNWFDVGTVSTSSGLLLPASARLHFVPAANYNGTPGALTVHAADNAFAGGYSNGATRATFDTTNDAATSGISVAGSTIGTSVVAVNDAPTITSAVPVIAITETASYDSAAFATASTATGTLAATDIDSDVSTLAYSIRGGTLAAGSWTKTGLYGTLTLNATTHVWSYTPDKAAAVNALAQGETGHDVFEFKVTDAQGGSSTQTIDVSLTGTNDIPLLAHAIADQSFDGAGTWKYQIPADSMTDAEGQGLTYTVEVVDGNGVGTALNLSTAGAWLSFDEATRTFTGNPPASWNDAGLTLRVTATDGNGAAVSDTFALHLTNTANEGPTVGTPLAWHAVHATSDTTDFTLGTSLGGSDFIFDGTIVTVGTAASGNDVASAFEAAFNAASSDGYSGTVAGNVLTLTADTAGNRTDFTTSTVAVPGGSYDIVVTTEGADAVTETADVQFAAVAGNLTFALGGVTINLTGPLTADEVAAAVAQQLAAGGATWTAAVDGTSQDILHLTATTAGALADITTADFTSAAASVTITQQGANAIAEVVQLTFTGSLGGAAITIDGVTASAGTTVSAVDTAAALAGVYSAHAITDLGNGSIRVTSSDVGDTANVTPASFTGTHGAITQTAHVDGAGWTYAIPAGTFTDPEGATLVYSAYTIDPATGTATLLSDSAALTFDEATATFSGDGAMPANTLIEIRAQDPSGATVATQFELAVTRGTTTASLTVGPTPAATTFVSGAGTGHYTLPANAFSYVSANNGSLHYELQMVDANGDPVPTPAWVHFDQATATISGNPPDGSADVYMRVIAFSTDVSPAITQPIHLVITAPNDPLVLVAPIADQSINAGAVFGLNVAAPFSNPDGAPDGTALSTGITYTATANGHPLSDYGLTLTVNPNGSLTFGGNPSAAEPYLTIVVTGVETDGGTSATTSFTLNLNDDPAPVPGTAAGLAANNPGAVTISGTATEGQTLTAALPTDADGVPAASAVHYQWQVSSDHGATWMDVTGGARGQSATLVLAESESAKDVRVQAFYNDGGGVAEAPVSNAVAVQNVNTAGTVTIAGVLTPGETLSATIADGDGLQQAAPAYQWFRDGVAVSGANYSAYTLTNADGGHSMTVAVSYTDDHGTLESAVSAGTATVMLGAVKPTAVDDSGSATEAGGVGNNVAGVNPSGNVLGNDFDVNSNLRTDIPIASLRSGNAEGLGDSASLAGDTYTIAGLYGTLTMNRVTGAWTYAVDQNNTVVDALAPGQSLQDSFNYTIGDTTNLFDTGVLNVTVNGVNDAPTLVGLPSVAVFTEDVAAAIRTSFSIVDPDGGTGFGLRLTVVNGTLRDAEPNGYTRPAGLVITGTDTHVLTITANSMGDVQNWLSAATLLYTSGPNQNGNLNDTLSYAVRDSSTGPFSAAGSTILEVDHANNPPVIDLGGAATAGNDYTATFRPRGGEVAVVASDVHISDIDAGDTIASATVTLTAGAFDNLFGTTYETLRSTAGSTFTGATSNTIAFSGNGTGEHGLTGATTLTLTGFGSQADYENALKTIVYNNTNPNAFSGPRTITISVTDDSGAASNTGSFATATANNQIAVGQRIFINGVDSGFTVGEVVDSQHFVASGPLASLAPGANLQFYAAAALVTTAVQTGPVIATTTVQVPWTPVIDMNGDHLDGRDHVVTYTEGQSGVALATSDASITDQDGNIASVVISLSNPLNGSAEKLFISNALVAQLAAFGVTVSGNNTAAITLGYDAGHPGGIDATYFQIGLRAVQYVNSSDFPDLTPRIVNVTSTDVDGNTGVGAHTTINMVGVNDAPNGTNGTITAQEDTALVIHAADFGFTDIDGNSLAAVKISSLPTAGTLTLDGATVAAGQVISLADIDAGKLAYHPVPDHSGPGQATFGFQVQDNGGTALGGIDLDPVANTLTINVTPVNDAPVLTAAAPQLVTIGENAVGNAGQLVSSFVGAGANHTGVSDIDTLNNGGNGSAPEAIGQGIAIHALGNDGTGNGGAWQYSLDGGTTWLAVGAVADGSSLLLRSTDMIRFQPDGLNGTVATFSYYLWDGATGTAGTKADVTVRGGTTAFSTGSDTSTITVTHANDAPVVDLNGGAPGNDLTTIFRPRGDAVAVVGNDIVITDADHLAGGVADTLVSATVTLTGGALDNLFGTTYETLSSTAVASFTGSLGAIAITGNGTGASGLTGATALTFTGAGTHADYQDALKTVLYNNSNPNAYSGDRTVQIVVRDASVATGNSADGLNSATVTTTIQVPWTPVVDMNGDAAPGRNGVATFVERSAGVAVASADASIVDQDGNIKQVVVTLTNHPDGAAEKLSISSALVAQLGSIGLTISGNNTHAITITGNKDGSVFQLALRAIQYSNSSAAPSAADRVVTVNSVDMQNNTGVGASTIIHITTINDAPVGIDSAVTLLEDSAYALRLQDFQYSDVEQHALAGVTITTLPTAGALFLNGVAVTAGQEVSALDIAAGLLVYRPVANANNGQNPPAPTLTFQVRDAGGVANGGIDRDATANTLTLNITPVNDLPTAANGAGVPAVSVAGVLREGVTLTAVVDIADVDRTGAEIAGATTYQWQSRTVPDGAWTAISGATASTYQLTGNEANHEVRVLVTYNDDLTVPSVVTFASDRADHPAIVADANGNIVLDIDTDLPVLITDPVGDVTVRNDGTGPLTVTHLPDDATLTYEGDGPVTLADPLGDVTIDTAGPGAVTVTGLDDDATVSTSGDGDVTVANPHGDVQLDNGGPGTVTVDSLNNDATLTLGGNGPTTVSNPDGDLTVVNAGPGTATVTGLNDDATLHTGGNGDVTVAAPEGSLTLGNDGPGTVTVDSLHAGETVTVSGNGPTTVSNPDGDLTVANAGPGTATVTGLNDDATVHTSGNGDVTIAAPEGSVNLDNGGPGTVTVDTLHAGETVTVGGAGPTTVSNPAGDVTLANAGPGTATVTGLNDDATLHTAGNGDVTVADPDGSLTLDNAGPGTVTVTSLNGNETVSVGGNGPTTVADPDGDLTVVNAGPAVATVTGLNDDATLHTQGAGNVTVTDPDGSLGVDNAGPGTVTVDGLNTGETLQVGGSGPTTVASPDGDLTVVNAGPGVATVTGLNDDAILHTAGNGTVTVTAPEGSLAVDNAGPGAVTVDGLHAGETVSVGGNGPTTVSNPDGDLTVVNAGPAVTTVTGLNDDATLHTSGNGDIAVAAPEGSVNLDNAGPGAVTVDSLHAGETVTVGGDGPTTVSNPAGDLTVVNAGPGATTVSGLNDDATLHTSGNGAVTVAAPEGSVNLDNAGAGTVTVDSLHAGETLHVQGNGPTTVATPDGDLVVVNDGPGTATVTGLHDDATVTMSGTGPVTVSAPVGDVVLHNNGTGAATVEHLNDGAALTVVSSTPTVVSAPLGDATLHNLGTGLLTVTGPVPDSQLDVTGNGAYAVDLAGFPDNGHITLNNVDGASLQVLHAPAGASIDALGAGDVTVLAPTGDLHIHNGGTGTMLVEQPADGITVTKTGTGPAVIDHPVGGFTLANDDSGAVTVQHLAAGSTLVLQGTGPVHVDSDLAPGEHVQVDTSANSNVQLANHGKGTIDVIGDLQLDSGDAMSIHLGGAATTAITVAGTVNLDGTPLNLTLDAGYAPHLGDSITLLDNDGSDAVVGTFANLAEGAPVYLGGSLFRISYAGGTGNDVVLTRVNDTPTGAVTISGTAAQNQTLTASNTLGDTDGMGTVSYRWLADGALVAVGASYVLTQAAVGKEITVVASYTDAEGTVESVTSDATAPVQNVNDAPTGAVLIGGTATLGQTLLASNALADVDGMGTVSYQWQADGVNIAGATGDHLTLTGTTIGKAITVSASYTDAYGQAESVTSAATVPVRDGNGVAPSTEASVPALHTGGLVGDGNGDGILDALQPSVVSMAVPTASGNGASYVTLVADSVGGKPVDGANALTNVGSVHNAIDLPSWAQAPMDGITFTSKVNAPGATENFSLYVDASSGVNGFWAENAHGVLVNLASAAYGGQMVTEGDKIRLDFHITEGSEFDAGAAGDSNIVSTGVAAHASLSLIGYVIDTPDHTGPGNAFD